MSDAQLFWFDYGGDIDIKNGDISSDNGLATAVLISLFTDARAPSEEILPDGETKLRGWWGDDYLSDGEKTGSLLWTLNREKALAKVASDAKAFCDDSLKWIKEYEIAEFITVDAQIVANAVLQIKIKISRGTAKKYGYLWTGSLDYQRVAVQKSSIELEFIE